MRWEACFNADVVISSAYRVFIRADFVAGLMRMSSVLEDIPLDKISMSTSQARQRDTKVEPDDDLVRSIQKHGLLSPVTVRLLEDGRYDLVIGQRRFLAHNILKLPTIKAHVLDQSVDQHTAKMFSLIENVARKDMKQADLMDAVQFFADKYGSTQTVADELGLSPSTVRKYMRAARLPPEIFQDTNAKKYSIDNALKALQALGDDESTVDTETLRETAIEMQKLSLPSRKKYIKIKQREPDLSSSEVAAKAKRQEETHTIKLIVTDDQLERIGVYQEREKISKDEDAASELLDLGLDAAEV